MRQETPRPDDLDSSPPSPYLRARKRVEVRRSAVRWKRVLLIGGAIAVLSTGVLAAAAYGIGTYLTFSPRFVLRDEIVVAGAEHVSRRQLAGVFARDAGRSVFEIPLDSRRTELMSLPWVASAYLVRGWPNRLRVQIRERTPLAFARVPAADRPGAGRLLLIDKEGVLLPLPSGGRFPFPVLAGISESQPPAERKKRVAVMLAVLEELDRETPRRSGEVSEIDLSDPEDAALTVTHADKAALVHLGSSHFLDRYKLFLENIEAWREQYGSVGSVDLRFEKQVIVKP